MFKTPAIITKVDNYKENHLLISVFSCEYGKKSLIVFGGKSKKKNTDFVKGLISEIEFNKENSCLNSNLIQSYNWFLFDKYRLKVIDYICFLIDKLLFLEDKQSSQGVLRMGPKSKASGRVFVGDRPGGDSSTAGVGSRCVLGRRPWPRRELGPQHPAVGRRDSIGART